jgi:hypothetical protein
MAVDDIRLNCAIETESATARRRGIPLIRILPSGPL